MQRDTDPFFPPEPSGIPEPSFDASGLEPDDGYRVSIPVFEGPIDLLLYLIRKNELDIHEVSLAAIAREYLEYVDLIRLVNLERAGEFIVVASTLMKIKSRSLFLTQPDAEDNPEEENERDALIRNLLEYQKLGGVADTLAAKEATRRGVYPRAGEKGRVVEQFARKENAPDYELFDLLTALKDVLTNAPRVATHEVELLNINPEAKQKEILEQIAASGRAEFHDLVRGQPLLVIVVTFIAMLELIKNRKIRIRQTNQFGHIELHAYIPDDITDT